jgi:hypothetical protein
MTTWYAKYGKIKTSNSSPSSAAKATEKQGRRQQNKEEQSLLVNIPSGSVELEEIDM